MNSSAENHRRPALALDSVGRQRTEEELHRLNAELSAQAADLQQLNRSLIDSEQRLRLALETGRIGLWVWNSTDVAKAGDWSPRLKEIFGLPPGTEVTHDLFLKCLHPEDRERVNAAVLAAISGANGGHYQLEYRAIHADESVHWVTARGQAFFNPDGTPFRFIGTVMDITERKRAEQTLTQSKVDLETVITQRTVDLAQANQALRQRKDELRTAIDTIPGLVWSSLPDGQIEYLNRRWLDYTGLTQEQAAGWGWQAAIHPDDLPGLIDYWKSLLTAGQPGEFEARLRRADDAYRWFLFRGVPLRDTAGQIVKWYGTNTDIEELHTSKHLARGQVEALTRTLEALAKESEPGKFLEHVLRTFVRQLSAHSLGVWEMNLRNGRMELVGNCENDRIYFAAEEDKADPSLGLIPPGDHPLWSEFFRSGERCVIGDLEADPPRIRLDNGNTWHSWLSAVVANPTVINMQSRLIQSGVVATLCVPLLLAGKVWGLISIRFTEKRPLACPDFELARALAHQAMLAIQLVRLSARSRLAAVAAERNRLARDIHDTIAQGLTGVIVQLEAAEDAQAGGLTQEAAAHLTRAAELARESLGEARRSVHALRPRALQEGDLCAALKTLFAKMSAGTHVRAEFRTEGTPRRLPAGVEENLLRIGQEVFTNAIRHARAGSFTAWLMFDPDALRLEFCDDGCGFDQAGKSDGFGLIGMEERVREMGGRLNIQSVVGVGTAISIVLALPDAATSAQS